MSFLDKFKGGKKDKNLVTKEPETQQPVSTDIPFMQKTGRSQGETDIDGADDQTVAVIIAAVSQESELSLDQIRIKSIRKIS